MIIILSSFFADCHFPFVCVKLMEEAEMKSCENERPSSGPTTPPSSATWCSKTASIGKPTSPCESSATRFVDATRRSTASCACSRATTRRSAWSCPTRSRDETIGDNKRTIASLEAVVDERARTIDDISGRLEQLAAQCGQLERDKAELNERCQGLQSEILRLRMATIENDVLRNKIDLVERNCATQIQSVTRQSNANVEQLHNESQARIDAMTNQPELEKRHITELADIRIRKKKDSEQRLAGFLVSRLNANNKM